MSGELMVWADVETTGLDERHDSLLEIAVLVTDSDLNLLDEDGVQFVVKHSPEEAGRLRATAASVVRDMHDATGLWGRLPEGTARGSVGLYLQDYLGQFAPNQSHLRPSERKLRLAGSSVKLDYAFIGQYLPNMFGQLNYRVVDVTSLAFLADEWTGCGYFEKAKTHAAMDDIRESLAELRWVRSQLGQ